MEFRTSDGNVYSFTDLVSASEELYSDATRTDVVVKRFCQQGEPPIRLKDEVACETLQVTVTYVSNWNTTYTRSKLYPQTSS